MNARLPSRRRIIYVDHVLQKWLLVAMVVLETLLTAAAIYGLYLVLSDIIDDNLYRVHLADADSMLQRLLFEGALILGATGVVNLSAIIAADRIWAWYVRTILRGLDAIMYAAHKLDFRAQSEVRRTHAVLDHALRWQRAQSLRLKRIRHAARNLPAALPENEPARQAALAQLAVIADRGRLGEDG